MAMFADFLMGFIQDRQIVDETGLRQPLPAQDPDPWSTRGRIAIEARSRCDG
jgi:hypothetical protein